MENRAAKERVVETGSVRKILDGLETASYGFCRRRIIVVKAGRVHVR